MLQKRLEEAEVAYHRLQTGKLAVTVTGKNGQELQFNRTNAHQLRTYIEELKAQLGVGSTRRRPPAGVVA
jgi:hypothetical protein